MTDRPVPERGGIMWHRRYRSDVSVGVSCGETKLGDVGEVGLDIDLGVNVGEFVAESKDLGSSLRFRSCSDPVLKNGILSIETPLSIV